jgi:hypothetical protein|nr:MAG TPA: hypothetical protein [Caudoviricetes sp.]
MNFLDLNKDNKFDTKDGQIILAYTFAAVGIFLLVAAFWVNPIAVIDISIQSAAGLLFSFCAAILGIDYHYTHLLSQTLSNIKKKKEEEE